MQAAKNCKIWVQKRYDQGHHAKNAQQETVNDYVLFESGKSFWLNAPFYPTDRINGTGDSLSACIAAELAKNS